MGAEHCSSHYISGLELLAGESGRGKTRKNVHRKAGKEGEILENSVDIYQVAGTYLSTEHHAEGACVFTILTDMFLWLMSLLMGFHCLHCYKHVRA